MPQRFSTPNVYRVETDESNVVAPAGTSTGALVGWAAQGPSNQRINLTFDKQFIEKFGEPNSNASLAGFAALEFLKESNSLWFVRATSGDEFYANIVLETSATTSLATLQEST